MVILERFCLARRLYVVVVVHSSYSVLSNLPHPHVLGVVNAYERDRVHGQIPWVSDLNVGACGHDVYVKVDLVNVYI